MNGFIEKFLKEREDDRNGMIEFLEKERKSIRCITIIQGSCYLKTSEIKICDYRISCVRFSDYIRVQPITQYTIIVDFILKNLDMFINLEKFSAIGVNIKRIKLVGEKLEYVELVKCNIKKIVCFANYEVTQKNKFKSIPNFFNL